MAIMIVRKRFATNTADDENSNNTLARQKHDMEICLKGAEEASKQSNAKHGYDELQQVRSPPLRRTNYLPECQDAVVR